MTHKRIKKELSEFQKDPPQNCRIELLGQSPFQLRASITGQDDSPYAGGTFSIDIFLPNDYPFNAPKVKFITKIYHPNINNNGALSLDMFLYWSPVYTISRVLTVIQNLIHYANPDNSLEYQVAQLYSKNRTKFDQVAKYWTQKYAK